MNRRRLLDLLKQPSTYAGCGVLAGVVGVSVEQWQAIAHAIAACAAVAAIFLDERAP